MRSHADEGGPQSPATATDPVLDTPWWRGGDYTPSWRSAPWLTTTLLLAVLISMAFVAVFRFQIAPAFAYGGIRFRAPSPVYLGISIAYAWVLILTLGQGSLRGARVLTAILVYLLGIPALIIPNIIEIQDRTRSFELVTFYFICLALIVIALRALPDVELPEARVPDWLPIALLLLFTIAAFWAIGTTVGIGWRPVGFREVYGARQTYSSRVAHAPTIVGYLIAIQMKAVGPILLVVGLASRRWRGLIVVAVTSQYLLFATTFAKQSLFFVFAAVLAYLLFRLARNADQRVVASVVLLVTLGTSLLDRVLGKVYWTEIVVDRFFFWPGFLPVQYEKTFQSRPYNLWSDSFLSHVVADRSPGTTPELLVGQGLTGKTGVFANTSFLGDGYANLGLAGILIEAAVVVGIIYAAGLVLRRFPLWVTAPLMVMPAVSLSNGSPFTAILSGALLPLIFFMWMVPTRLLVGDGGRAQVRSGDEPQPARQRITLVTGYFDEFAGYYEVSLARELSKNYDVTVVTGNRVAPTFGADALARLGLDGTYPVGVTGTPELSVVRLRYSKIGSLLLPRGILRVLRTQPSDVVLVLAAGQGFSVPAAILPIGATRVSIFGDNRAQWEGVRAMVRPLKWIAFSLTKGVLYWFVMQRSTLIYGVTPNTLKRLEPFSTGSLMRLWPLGVEGDRFAFAPDVRSTARQALGVSGTTFGIVGKVSREKQIERVIAEFAYVAERSSGARLVISGLGSDPYSRALRARVVDDARIAERVTLLGFLGLSEMVELMSALDVCVWPVQPAITIQQALVMGCRVVVPDNDLVGFLTNRGEFGSAFRANDRDGLRDAMLLEAEIPLSDFERAARAARAQSLTMASLAGQLVGDLRAEGALS